MSESPPPSPGQKVLESAERLRGTHGRDRRRLSIAVLGPADDSKRIQIRDFLSQAGHSPFFPERRINLDTTWVLAEAELLSREDVHLIIVLQTASSRGVIAEIGALALVPAVRAKTAILTPKEHYDPDRGFLANTINCFPIQIPYTKRHFKECCLIEDCWRIVEDFLVGELDLGAVADV